MLKNNPNKVVNQIKSIICDGDPNEVYFATDFPQFDYSYVNKVLADLNRQGILYRLARGIYVRPVQTRFGILYPPVETIVKAIAKRDGAEILPSGAVACNVLGFSTQVPMNYVYLTTGSARKLTLGKTTISFKHGVPRNFAIKGEVTRLIVQALKFIGQRDITDEDIGRLRELIIKYPERDTIVHDITVMPLWIKKIYKQLLNSIDND